MQLLSARFNGFRMCMVMGRCGLEHVAWLHFMLLLHPRGVPFLFLWFCWSVEEGTQMVNGSHVEAAGGRVGWASCKKVIEVVNQMLNTIVLLQYPLDGRGKLVEQCW